MSLSLVEVLVQVLKYLGGDSFLDLNEFLSESLDLELTIMNLALSLFQLLLMSGLSSLETSNFKIKIFSLVL